MRPSLVRSKSAPQASSSFTRSGASLACSSAMRQLFTYWPPRMVSAKWTRQLSRSSTLASAAATPPSAMTVCALPRSDLQTRPTERPVAAASIAARRPAPPAPLTTPSWSKVASSVIGASPRREKPSPVACSQDPEVVPGAGRAHPDVDVAERHREEAHPGPAIMHVVGAGRAGVGQPEDRLPGELVAEAAQDVAHRVAAQGVPAQAHHIDGQDHGA